MELAPGIISVESDTKLAVLNEAKLRGQAVDMLVHDTLFHQDATRRGEAAWALRHAAAALGAYPASVLPLYKAIGRGEHSGFTVPAMNLRTLTYDSARAAFRAAVRAEVGALVFELARSEMGYSGQRPAEYASCILGAAIKEGWRGPVFIQGDHFQFQPTAFRADAKRETEGIKSLAQDSIQSGFFNMDIDASTLVDLSRPSLEAQQELNCRLTAELTRHIRSLEPKGISVSIGGEIGEVGGQNSTEEDLRAFMSGYLRELGRGLEGISKVSIQTGTSHGGVVLPDGSIAQVKVDFDTLARLSKLSREEYGMGGAVQHGASTLSESAFHRFPEVGCLEIHLATGFMNRVLDSRSFPSELRAEMYRHTHDHTSDKRKSGETDEQFIYHNRKYALGPFKRRIFDMPVQVREAIASELEDLFAFLFQQLRVTDTLELVRKAVPPVAVPTSLADARRRAGESSHPAAHEATEAGE
ncbi:MAG: class II fructose-bisphosphate aldolase [Chloroflexota bacterium]|nr:class II fructose-bisphosphate aldolase [Chloroflexota bacterium]